MQNKLSSQFSLHKLKEEELFFSFWLKDFNSNKFARVQVNKRGILNKDEVIIESLEIDQITTTPLKFTTSDTINELKIEEINFCDDDYGVLGSKNISLLIGEEHCFNIVNGKIKRLNPKLVTIKR
ncbi:hypothetical protein NPIL_376551 [Nephila pilipes]|uniref:Uncharacterized protein n=1 Tax=Nephila pilipes TaxID=299642 RepID=A0A8X6U991_NEPPI|nr:hypothetical protein NPIL_376551 [Nephila pilipes]